MRMHAVCMRMRDMHAHRMFAGGKQLLHSKDGVGNGKVAWRRSTLCDFNILGTGATANTR